MGKRRIEEQLDELSALRCGPREAAIAPARKALADRVNLVVAKGATLAAELDIRELVPDLLRAFDRLFQDGVKRDPQCWGKNALAKALKELEYREAAPYVRGAEHVQMEPVWGGQADTATSLRGICLLALPACADIPREQVLRHLVNALTEPAPPVRADAARALAEMQGDECALLLRLKARVGDVEPAVTGQVLESLLAIERKEGIPFVKSFLERDDELAQEAALALGGSRLNAAVELLLDTWKSARGAEFRQAILRGLSISRQDSAIEFLQSLIAEGRPQDAADARAALDL
jgi:HEAT repeat protein